MKTCVMNNTRSAVIMTVIFYSVATNMSQVGPRIRRLTYGLWSGFNRYAHGVISEPLPGADTGYGKGGRQGSLGTEVPQRDPGAKPR